MNDATRTALEGELRRLKRDRENDQATRGELQVRMRVIDANIEKTDAAIAQIQGDLDTADIEAELSGP